MLTKLWKFKINNSNHCLKLKHNNILGIKQIFLDGIRLAESKNIFCFKENTNFDIDKHQCELNIDSTNLQPKYFFSIDNKILECEHQEENTSPLPYWIWISILACGLIPITCIEGVVALFTGIFGIYKCIKICSNIQYSNKKKAYICAKITTLCWIFIEVYMFTIKYITIYLNEKLY